MTKKKIIVICLSAAFVIFAAAAVWFVSTLADKPSENPDDTKEARQLIYTDEANLFESLTIKNANGEYTLIRDGDEIKVKGRENITLLPATSKAVFETFAEVYVVKTITENGTDGFGFDEPSAVLTLKKVDGTTKTMLVGDFAPNTENCRYMCFEGEKTVYLLDSDRTSRFMGKVSVLYSKTVSKYFTSDQMVSISIKRADGEEILLRPSNEEEQNDMSFISGYTMEKPFVFGADSDTVTSLCKTLSSLPKAEIAEDEVTDEKLSAYGISTGTTITVVADLDTTSVTLDNGEVNPYYDAANKEGKIRKTTVYRIGSASENKIYFTYDDLPIIYSVEKSAFDFINTDTYQFCQRLVNIAYLTDLSSLTVDTCDGKTYTFDIKCDTDGKGEKAVSEVTLDYSPVDVDNFKSFYQNIVAISHNGLGKTPDKKEDVLRLVYNFTDGHRETVEFLKTDDERKVFMTVDGDGRFVVLKTKTDKIKSDLKKLLSGETVITG